MGEIVISQEREMIPTQWSFRWIVAVCPGWHNFVHGISILWIYHKTV